MKQDYKYPSVYEIKEVLGSITNRSFLNDFAQRKGIFITNSSQQQLATDLSNLFFDDEDLERIRMEAYNNKANHTLSGFLVRSNDKNFNLKNIYEYARENSEFGTGKTLASLQKVSNDGEELCYRGRMEYVKPKAGRIQFLQNERSAFDFYLNRKDEGQWQVEVDASRSNDLKELKSIFSDYLAKGDSVELIEHALLNTMQTIAFFDALAKQGMDNNWQFLDTKHLTLKQGNTDSDEDNSEDQTKEVTSSPELTGISQAILKGQNLRENNFVRQCVNDGYQFTAMTYEFGHKSEPYFIQVKAEFKGKPKVFEVSIVAYEENVGIPLRREPANLTVGQNRLIRSAFWNNAKEIFDKLPKQGAEK